MGYERFEVFIFNVSPYVPKKPTSDCKSFKNRLHLLWNLGPLHTWAKSCDHGIMRPQKKVSTCRSNTPPKSCSVVTDPQMQCKVICDWSLNQMLFQWILIHVCPQIWLNRINQRWWAFAMLWSPGFVLSLPTRDDFLKIVQVTMKHDPFAAM